MELTHLDQDGNVTMVNVGEKSSTVRKAVAQAVVHVNVETMALIKNGEVKKGNVIACAKIAGIMAAKKTWDLIPMCHPVAITGADVAFDLGENTVTITATATTTGQTGVEMEAMTGASIAALTIYDMCKGVQRDIVISQVVLLHKSGGKSGVYNRKEK